MKKVIVLAILVLFGFNSAVMAADSVEMKNEVKIEKKVKKVGPFGLKMGMKVSEFKDLTPVKGVKNMYTVKTVPKPHNGFESYKLIFHPKTGLCGIKGIGKVIQTNSFGTQIKSEFKDLKKLLDKAYGNGEIIDRLMVGSIWKDSDDWLMALGKKERDLVAYWMDEDEDGKKLPTLKKYNIDSMMMQAHKVSHGECAIILEYQFENFVDMMKLKEKEEVDSL